MEIDRKFHIAAVHKTKGKGVTDSEAVLFLCKDDAFPATLQFYRAECMRLGVGVAQVEGIDLLIERVALWRRRNKVLCRNPDIDQGPEVAYVNRPNEPTER